MDALKELNKIHFDEFGRPWGIILTIKPPGVSAHDIVTTYRRKFGIQRIGHAGALDVFASGLIIILIGKATKYSNLLLNLDKTYKARLLLGIRTDTQDIEGKIIEIKTIKKFSEQEITEALDKFKGKYEQFVSIYSSVKVKGLKLRKVMRNPKYTIEINDRNNNKYISLWDSAKQVMLNEIEVPKRTVTIYEIQFLNSGFIKGKELEYKDQDSVILKNNLYQYVDFAVKCSKGTYIRQLAEDIGDAMDCPASLTALERTGIGELTEKDIYQE